MLPFAILAGIAVFAALSPYESTKTPPPGTPGSLVWGDGIFSNRVEMKAWLKLHGGRYAEWAKLHPKALSLVKSRAKPHAAALAAKKKTPKTLKTRTTHSVVASPAVASSSQGGGGGFAPSFFIVLGLVLTVGAIWAPRRIFVRVGAISADRDREVRLAMAGFGVAVIAGAGIAYLLA